MKIKSKITPMGNYIAIIEYVGFWSIVRFTNDYKRFIILHNVETREEALRFIEEYYTTWRNMRN